AKDSTPAGVTLQVRIDRKVKNGNLVSSFTPWSVIPSPPMLKSRSFEQFASIAKLSSVKFALERLRWTSWRQSLRHLTPWSLNLALGNRNLASLLFLPSQRADKSVSWAYEANSSRLVTA